MTPIVSGKRPIGLAILAIVVFMLVGQGTAAALSDPSGLENFQKNQHYDEGMFSDVSNTSWYYENVKTIYEYGIMNGMSDSLFAPKDSVTIAQALVMAARTRSIYEGTAVDFSPTDGEKWYMPYVRYAVMKGIIRVNDFYGLYDKAAARMQLAHIYANVLPASEYGFINEISTIPDVGDQNVYFSEILKLYKAGILSGSDRYGTFHPLDEVSRAEAAAVISRLFLPDLRKELDLDKYDGIIESGIKDCVYEWEYPEGLVEWSYTLSIPTETYDIYKAVDREHLSYGFFVTNTSDDEYLAALADEFRTAAKTQGFSEWQMVHLVISFVQDLEYVTDIEGTGYDEYAKFPIETLYEQNGDCEDRSILLASLLRELDYGSVLIVFDDHMGVGIKGDSDLAGYYWTYDNEDYFYIETTGKGFEVGELPDEYTDEPAEVLPL